LASGEATFPHPVSKGLATRNENIARPDKVVTGENLVVLFTHPG
jgi:hypothetical protein